MTDLSKLTEAKKEKLLKIMKELEESVYTTGDADIDGLRFNIPLRAFEDAVKGIILIYTEQKTTTKKAGYLAQVEPQYAIPMYCEDCDVEWTGCFDACHCPQCKKNCMEPPRDLPF